jgi:hypothetical protein
MSFSMPTSRARADAALGLVGVFDHEGGLPVAAVGDQRVVDVQFVLDARRLEDALDAQHFLDLVLHGQGVLEIQGGVVAQGERGGSSCAR